MWSTTTAEIQWLLVKALAENVIPKVEDRRIMTPELTYCHIAWVQ